RDFSASVIDSLPGLFGMVDRNGRYVRWNKYLPNATGLSDEQLRGLDIISLVIHDDRELARTRLQDALANGSASGEFGMRVKDGGTRIIQVSGRTITRNAEPYVLIVGVDVTDARAAGKALAYRDHLLHAFAGAAAELMAERPLAISMQHALETAGHALQVDRILVLQGPSLPATAPGLTLAFDWQRPGVPRLTNASFVGDPAHATEILDWLAPLREGKPVMTYADAATGFVADIMRDTGNLSILS